MSFISSIHVTLYTTACALHIIIVYSLAYNYTESDVQLHSFLDDINLFSTGSTCTLAESSVEITSAGLLREKYACPGATVTFTCRVNGSSILSWISTDYIGEHHQLHLTAGSEIGQPVGTEINSDTMATLTDKDGGVLTSELRIVVSLEFRNPSVTCRNGGLGEESTISFTVFRKLVHDYILVAAIGYISSKCITTAM